MSKVIYEFSDDENLMEMEEDYDAPSSRKIGNGIHDFSEIMDVGDAKAPSTRFGGGGYNPKRRQLLTENSRSNIVSAITNSSNSNVTKKSLPQSSNDMAMNKYAQLR
jgi:hypothetical protein